MTVGARTSATPRTGLSTAELAQELGVDGRASDLVMIDRRRLASVASHIRTALATTPHQRARWDDPLFWNVDAPSADRSQYFAVGCAVNFRFWSLAEGALVPAGGLIDGVRYRGSMYMWRCLRRTLDRGVFDLLDAEVLANFSEDDFDAVFGDDAGLNPLSAGRTERIRNLRDLGQELLSGWDGSFFELVEATGGSLVRFAELSRQMRAFDDPVYKLTMVNAILHMGSGVFEFADDPLPGIDYHLLCQALRQGILRPGGRLSASLSEMSPLDASTGLELRRVALLAFVGLSELSGLSGEVIDNSYWLNREHCGHRPVCLDPQTADACPFLSACRQATQLSQPLEYTRYY